MLFGHGCGLAYWCRGFGEAEAQIDWLQETCCVLGRRLLVASAPTGIPSAMELDGKGHNNSWSLVLKLVNRPVGKDPANVKPFLGSRPSKIPSCTKHWQTRISPAGNRE